MESTWAVAAQYCPHELGLKVYHFGHHEFQHKKDDKSNAGLTSISVENNTNPDADNDCPYCHLGSMKSMISILLLPIADVNSLSITPVNYSYPDVTPSHPERPNWLVAA